MGTFKFYQDIKCSIWQRQFFSIEAESEEEAKRIAMKFQDEDVSAYSNFERSEFLHETEEYIPVDENDGADTMQLYLKGEEYPFATNGSDEYKKSLYCFDEFKSAHAVASQEISAYPLECTYKGTEGSYCAFHKDGKLVVILLDDEDRAVRYTFHKSWSELVAQDTSFQNHMANYLKNKFSKNPYICDEIMKWLNEDLTQMFESSNKVGDTVPFTLEELVMCAHGYANIFEYKAAKLLGYQVVGEDGVLPGGYFSFHVIRDIHQAKNLLHKTEVEEPHLTGLTICPIYEGDIEEPSFI